jgi:hypothetical protein
MEGDSSRNENSMKKTRSKKKPLSADAIAGLADNGKDVSRFFTNSGKMMKPVQRVHVDFTIPCSKNSKAPKNSTSAKQPSELPATDSGFEH